MESKEIIENNKLLAEFIGYKENSSGNIVFEGISGQYYLDRLYFHKYWDWIMRAAEKIEAIKTDRQLLFQVVINGFDCCIEAHEKVTNFKSNFHHCERTKIEAVYHTCVAFIKWYNKQNKQPWKE